ncbi:Beta-N-acetylhexosaminidase [Caldicellulosiruptor hydrothermalis 108]|uniref:beta-N-acetylhexosaminidase n=1 Tax=Caldicellulosiruptor hydrothermalis (strain DSM 18901 / VKM B-2411 / 108) TaxID=632292 RepID=E4Q8R8_CALH1|nr:glycoside hydrolase family 3 N-terminal domain-containing protein [Caldicellulosiruptor hydrothermalis]ADQ08042.1 Beta-N-acetylhexosaminidase [Caldicellulosiruptor hydrothermalis 108]
MTNYENKIIGFKTQPFYLKDEDIKWVIDTFNDMNIDEKIGQLFCLIAHPDEKYLNYLVQESKVGGVLVRPMFNHEIIGIVRFLQTNSKIPLLIAGNLEAGGDGVSLEGTNFGCPLAVAATDDVEMAYRLGVVCGREAKALGLNWAFAPVVDIDFNFRNPITNTRTFGSDPERVAEMGCAFIKAVQQQGLAATAKHFPGDGVDERDQHLVTSINTLSCEDWDATFGMVYKKCIQTGVMSIMVGHISLPAYSKVLNPDLKDEDILPASLSPEIVTGLLKEKLGFKGLVVTDASTMAGMMIPMGRERAVPQAIAAGCDMFLFAFNIEEDFKYMKQGLESGILTEERLNDAVLKILAFKAALGLHKNREWLIPDIKNVKKVVKCKEHLEWAKECADRSITLVKEEKGVLPISPEKIKNILLYSIDNDSNVLNFFNMEVKNQPKKPYERFKRMLEKEGFNVEVFEPRNTIEGENQSYEEFVNKYNLIIYLVNLATKSNQTVVRIEWAQPRGANVPVFINKIPTIFISLANPYHLLDVPRVKTYINAYGSSDIILEALLDKLMGRSEFKGKSPVDPFCGKWDARL